MTWAWADQEPINSLSLFLAFALLNYSNLLLKLVNVELQKDIDNLFAPSLVAHKLSLPARRTVVISPGAGA